MSRLESIHFPSLLSLRPHSSLNLHGSPSQMKESLQVLSSVLFFGVSSCQLVSPVSVLQSNSQILSGSGLFGQTSQLERLTGFYFSFSLRCCRYLISPSILYTSAYEEVVVFSYSLNTFSGPKSWSSVNEKENQAD